VVICEEDGPIAPLQTKKRKEKNMNLKFFGVCKKTMDDGNMYDLNVDSNK
jgi:hypothetical protein